MRRLFAELAGEAGPSEPDRVGRRLALLWDGALIGTSMEGDRGVVAEARAMAQALIGAPAPSSRERAAAASANPKAKRRTGT